jgi:serine/threonine protein kinase
MNLESMSCIDMGLFELIHHIHNRPKEPKKLEAPMSIHVAEYATAKAKELAWSQCPTERHENEARMAQFDLDEIELGPLLGVGGFSMVYEINSFKPNPKGDLKTQTEPRNYSQQQQLVRDFLTRHSQRLSQFEACKDCKDCYSRFPTSAAKECCSSDFAIKPLGPETKDDSSELMTESVELPTTARYALKHLRRGLVHNPDKFAKAAMDLSCEAQMMMCLDHPNIVKLRGWTTGGPSSYKKGSHNSYFLIIDRLVNTLEDRIWSWRKEWKRQHRRKPTNALTWAKKRINERQGKSNGPRKPEPLLIEKLRVAYDLSNALEYLHERRIVYRDLKSSNIGFDIRGDVKIFDFGLSRFMPTSTENLEESFRMSHVGTRCYSAPEVEQNKPYNLKADVYSFGVVMWEMLTMSSPRTVKKNKENGGFPVFASCPCWPTDLQNLVTSMLDTDPIRRPTMKYVRAMLAELLMHVSDEDASAELQECLNQTVRHHRRRSTFRLEFLNAEEFTDFDDETVLQSHTSVSTSFSTSNITFTS